MPASFDVFLSHNSKDKPAVREVGLALRARGLSVWLDEWELIPGRPWLEALERALETIACAAVLVGKDGLGPWEIPEMRACLGEFVRRNLPVIPVLLPGAPETPRLPILLNQFTWVDLRPGLNAEGLDRLEWGITGKRPELRPAVVSDIQPTKRDKAEVPKTADQHFTEPPIHNRPSTTNKGFDLEWDIKPKLRQTPVPQTPTAPREAGTLKAAPQPFIGTGPDPADAEFDQISQRILNAKFERRRPPAELQTAAPRKAEALESAGQPFTEPLTGIRFLWIPGGRFQMGSNALPDEQPIHWVQLSPFWVGETQVTNAQYSVFLEKTKYTEPDYWRDKRFSSPEQPVVGVSWYDVRAFCAWLAKVSGWEVTLPSEAQWEFAARGTDGREYPWGPERPDSTRSCFGLDYQKGQPTPAGSYPAGRGPFGTLDQAGNGWEWCRDAWDAKRYLKLTERRGEPVDPIAEVPQGDQEEKRVVRGGGWLNLVSTFGPPSANGILPSAGTTTSAFALLSYPQSRPSPGRGELGL
ncbi:MAG TPA: SUMF1/EgtB/PvdO family nonheme iron enzyme [Thermoanaerobaculia bacterium]|jgi:formylglycine-generating enzyme required for sulfatase activity|nr:SUMF1/EgtB/PvdO family nonheme iron enzyme [Thermoanaerobaculia bacterium]